MNDGQLRDPLPVLLGKGFVGSLWRHRLLFAVVFLSILAIAVVSSVVLPSRYLATASVIVAEADPATRISDVWAQKQGDPADLESQIMILRSARLLKLALAQPGAHEAAVLECRQAGDSCADFKADDPRLADKVAERFSIAAIGRSRVLSVAYNSALPETAMAMANALVTAYLDDQRGSQSNSREVAAKWLWQEIADLDKEIRDRVTKIESFRRENGLVQGANASISSESLTNASQQLSAAEQAKAQAQARLDALSDLRNGGDIAASGVALENRTVGDLKQQIASVANQLAASSTVLGPRHPQLRMLEASLGVLQRQLRSEIDRLAASAQKDLEAASSLVVSLQGQVTKAKDNAASALSDESSIEGMVRDVEAKRQLYTQLYQRASELESERRSLNGGARLVSLADMPTKPYFPKKTPMVAAGLALGLFFASASCVLWDRFGGALRTAANGNVLMPRRSRQPKQTADALPVIGTLPSLPMAALADRPNENLLTVIRRSLLATGFQQSARQLASDLLDVYGGRPFLFTTMDPRSRHAAFASLLVGQAMAKSGLNVLVIECGSAKPEFSAAFDLPADQPTLADVLTGHADPASAVSSTFIPGLHVVAGGQGDLELVAGGRLQGLHRLIDWAAPYDVVLLTGPALGSKASERAVRMLSSSIEINAVLCLADDMDADQKLQDAGELLSGLDIGMVGAVLLPALGRDIRQADPFARQRRKAV